MAPRANWKGYLKVGELTCPVALYTAASTSERISFHTLNRETGHRVHRQFVDEDTGEVVDKEDQAKGYEVSKGEFVILDPQEVAAAVPESDKTLAADAFILCRQVDTVYFDRPYYLGPADPVAVEAYALLREAMRKSKAAALAQAVLFRRVRKLLIRPYRNGMIANTLQFDYEVRSSDQAFKDIPDLKIEGEMLDLAKHIINTKKGKFDPTKFDDRYEAALAELVKAKLEGREVKVRKPPEPTKVVDLMEALRQSANAAGGSKATRRKPAKASTAKKASGSSRKGATKRAAAKRPAASSRTVKHRKAS